MAQLNTLFGQTPPRLFRAKRCKFFQKNIFSLLLLFASQAVFAQKLAVQVANSVSVEADGGNIVCPGGSVILVACCAESYLWNTGETSSEIEVFEAGTYSVVATFADNSTATAEITISGDTSPPEILFGGIPTEISAACDDVPAVPSPEFIDNCSADIEVSFSETTDLGSCPNNYVIVRTWTAVDEAGNSTFAQQIVSVNDSEPPVLTEVEPQIQAECGQVPLSNPTAMDNCSNSITLNFSEVRTNGACSGNFNLYRIWTADDGCGNTATAQQTVVVRDQTMPSVGNFETEIRLDCSHPMAASITSLPLPESWDACDDSPSVVVSVVEEPGGTSCHRVYIRQIFIEDDCGNALALSQRIVVEDKTPPVFGQNPPNISVNCEQGQTVQHPFAEDICSGGVIFSHFDVAINEQNSPNGCRKQISRTWKATDECGNFSTFEQLITVVDNLPPHFSEVPPPQVFECGAGFEFPQPVAVDNCGEPRLTFLETKIDGDCPGNFTLRRIWTATDLCGNTATVATEIQIHDTQPPVFSNLESQIQISCEDLDSDGSVVVPMPTVADACDLELEVSANDQFFQTDNPCERTFMRVWTAVDDCGNSAQASQMIQILDSAAPVFKTFPTQITIPCGETAENTPPRAEDNCDNEVQVTLTETTEQGGCAGEQTITRIWTAVDNCGNTATVVQVISMVDEMPPSFEDFPTTLQMECGSVLPEILPAATDNCGGAVSVEQVSKNNSAGDCDGSSILTRVFVATDACGNTSTAEQTIFFNDLTAPILENLPAAATYLCQALPAPQNVSATDVCDDAVNLNFEETVIEQGACGKNGQIVRRWTATDDCGNTAVGTQIVTIEYPLPAISIEGSVKICTGGSGNLTATGGTSYSWSTGATGENIQIVEAGTYTVTATGGECGCTTTASFTVEAGAPEIEIEASLVELTCENPSAILTATGAVQFVWENGLGGGASIEVAPTTTQVYTVVGYDASGCSASASITIVGATDLADSDGDGICDRFDNCDHHSNPTQTDSDGDKIGDACDADDDNDGVADQFDCAPTDPTVFPGAKELCDGKDNNCNGQVDERFSIQLVSKKNVTCFGGSDGAIDILVDCGLAPYTFKWSNGATTEDLTNLPTGVFTVTATDALGQTRVLSVQIRQPLQLILIMEKRDVKCNGQATGRAKAIVKGGSSPHSFLWSNGSTTQNLDNIAAGTYSVIVTSATGCTITGSVTVTEPAPQALAMTNSVKQSNGKFTVSLQASGGTPGYLFRRCNTSNNGCTNWQTSQTMQNVVAGTYIFVVRDNNGCTTTVQATVGSHQLQTGEGDDRHAAATTVELAAREIRVFPNPVRGGSMFLLPGERVGGSAELILTDAFGKNMGRKTLEIRAGETLEIQLDGLANGVYRAVLIFADNKAVSKTFVLNRE